MEPQNAQTPAPVSQQAPSSWSWGGFMFDPVILVATKNYTYLLFYILALIPFVSIFVVIGMKIYMGLKAHEMIAASHAFANRDEAAGFGRGIDHAGKIFFYFTLITLAIILAFFVIAIGIGFTAFSRYNFPSSILMWW